MKKALTYISLNNILLLLLLTLSGFFSGMLGEMLYFLAFAIPIGIYCLIVAKGGEEAQKISFAVKKRESLELFAFVFPTLALIFLISWLTSLILSLVSLPPETDVSGNIIKEIFIHAALPSVLEEFVFRYFPLRLLMPHSRKSAVIISSLIFGLVHGNAFQIPYALAAGFLFALLDVMYESLLPSLLLHFLNNLISIIWMRNASMQNFVLAFIVILVTGAVLSVVFLFLQREKPFKKLLVAFKDNRKFEFTYPFVIFMALLISVVLINAAVIL